MVVEIDRDAQRRVLETLTAACSDIRHGGGESPLLDELLAQPRDDAGWFAYNVDRTVVMPSSRKELVALVGDVAQDVAEQIQVQAFSAVGYAMLLFCTLALEVERNCPSVSIDSFLAEAGRQLAIGDDNPSGA